MSATSSMPAFIDPDAVEASLDNFHTLPVSWYSDPDIFQFEIGTVFGQTWQVAAPLEQLSNPGDYVVTDAGKIPVVVVRGNDGTLRGFVNVCRHRGYPVATEGNGSRAFFQCQYHGWTYNLDGELRRAPGCAAGEFSDAGLTLLPVTVDIWNRWVFVNAKPDAGRLLDAFPELDDVASRLSFDPSDYRYGGVNTVDVQANWKGWCENGVECYHCPTIHKNSFDSKLASAPFSSGDGVYEFVTDNLIAASAAPRERSRAADGTVEHLDTLRFIFLFPGTFLIQDPHSLTAGYTRPVAPGQTQFVAHTYVKEGVSEDAISDWLAMWDQTFAEDAEAARLQSIGYASGQLVSGQLSRRADTMITKFHELVWRHYRRQDLVGQKNSDAP